MSQCLLYFCESLLVPLSVRDALPFNATLASFWNSPQPSPFLTASALATISPLSFVQYLYPHI